MNLRLDWVGYDAAKYACEKWHYSKCTPKNKLNSVGVWEDGKYIGVVIFSPGAAASIGKPYNLNNFEICELTRVALSRHKTNVTKIISVAIKLLRKYNPDLKLIVSYADPHQDHVGGIYQGGNWVYTGVSASARVYFDKLGKQYHSRNVGPVAKLDKFGITIHAKSEMVRSEKREGKHKYIYPLTKEMKANIEVLRKPYPKKKGVNSVFGNTSSVHEEEGGSNPTLTHGDK